MPRFAPVISFAFCSEPEPEGFLPDDRGLYPTSVAGTENGEARQSLSARPHGGADLDTLGEMEECINGTSRHLKGVESIRSLETAVNSLEVLVEHDRLLSLMEILSCLLTMDRAFGFDFSGSMMRKTGSSTTRECDCDDGVGDKCPNLAESSVDSNLIQDRSHVDSHECWWRRIPCVGSRSEVGI